MPYIEETNEYLEFLKSKEYNEYLQEIQDYKEIQSGEFYNKFIDIDHKFIITFD